MNIFLRNLPSCICFLAAGYLLATGVTFGWGWLIFAGIVCIGDGTVKITTVSDSK